MWVKIRDIRHKHLKKLWLGKSCRGGERTLKWANACNARLSNIKTCRLLNTCCNGAGPFNNWRTLARPRCPRYANSALSRPPRSLLFTLHSYSRLFIISKYRGRFRFSICPYSNGVLSHYAESGMLRGFLFICSSRFFVFLKIAVIPWLLGME